MAKNAYFGTGTGNFGTGTAMYVLYIRSLLPALNMARACHRRVYSWFQHLNNLDVGVTV